MPAEEGLSVIGCPEHRAAAARIIDRSITLVKNSRAQLPITPQAHKRAILYSVSSVSLAARVLGKADKAREYLNSVYTRSGQNSTPNSNATNLHSSQKRCCSFCISSSNASPTFQVQKSIFHQMTKPIQVTVILPLLLAISLSWNDDIHSSISGISNDLIGVIPTIGQ